MITYSIESAPRDGRALLLFAGTACAVGVPKQFPRPLVDGDDLTISKAGEPPLPIEQGKIEIREDPTEPNIWRLTLGDRWLAVVQLNGEFTVTQQEAIMGAFARCGHRYPPRAT